MNKLQVFALAAAVNGALAARTGPALAETEQERIDALDQKVRVLERKLEIQDEEAAKKAKETPVLNAGEKGFSLESRDKAFVLKLRGLAQADYRHFENSDAAAGTDTFLLRRVRPIVEGTVYDKYDFRLTPEFGTGANNPSIQDAYVHARFIPEATLKVGKFTVPVGLERFQSENDTRFAERGLPTNLVPNRDIGLQAGGEFLEGNLTYTAGYFNGSADGRSSEDNAPKDTDNNDDKDIAARVFVTPFDNSDNFALRGFGFGVGATHVDQTGSSTNTLLPAGYRSPGQATIFSYRAASGTGTSAASATFGDGKRDRLAPQAYYYYGPLSVIGEYTTVEQDVRRFRNTGTGDFDNRAELTHKAWQISGGYLLTGEDATFSKGVNVKEPFKIGGPGWGAVELVARYGVLDLDNDSFKVGAGGASQTFANPNTSVSKAKALGLGVNWYLNRNVKLVVDTEKTRYDGGAGVAPVVADREDEHVYITRLQVAF